MSESNPTALIACTDNGNGRCASHDNGRHVLDANGLCKIGRRLRKEMCECPVCKSQFPAKSGMVLADQREEATAFSALNALIAQVGDNAVCSKCAQESNEDFDRAIFVTPEAFRKSVKDFVEKFQRGATVMHRHEWLGGQMRNWCDHCGRLVALDAEENMGGVIRGNSVICLCEHCNALAHEALPDLPTVSFFEGLEQVSSFRRPQPKPVTAPQTEFSCEDRPARPALPSAPAPTPRQAETEPAQGEEIESAPTVAVPSTPARKPLASVKDIYDALLAGDRRVNFGVTNKNTMLTGCTVHSTRSSLCKTPEGSRWEQMRSVVRDGKAYGFCPTCTAELSVSGVRLEMTHKEAMVQIGVATNGNNGGVNRERLEFPDPTARAGKSVSNARKRELAQNALERAELE
ncbi:hypothetical protein L6260_02625, partial [Candidatus Parcubacteria bacterium]|nr:hypothetical protein [Candidatus Parcubacteria bacterium]